MTAKTIPLTPLSDKAETADAAAVKAARLAAASEPRGQDGASKPLAVVPRADADDPSAASRPGGPALPKIVPAPLPSRAPRDEGAPGRVPQAFGTPMPDPGTRPATLPGKRDAPKAVDPVKAPLPRAPKRRAALFPVASFLMIFLIPTLLVMYYYAAVASNQYRVETQFAVRGSNSFSGFGSQLGIGALPGMQNQASDSYILTDYIDSTQVIADIRRNAGVDVRDFYSGPEADFVHRIDPEMPLEIFLDHWRRHTNVEYNSVTGNTTFEVFAFTPEDAVAIADLVLLQSQRLVNELSRESREQLITSAREEVERTEGRLSEAQGALRVLREENQTFDPTQLSEVEVGVIQQLEGELSDLRASREALRRNIGSNSPRMRVLDNDIAAKEAQLLARRANIGSGRADGNDDTLAGVLSDFTEAQLAAEFSKEAYTSALASLEAALTDARKQQRYLATYVAPREPTAARHPRRVAYVLVAAFWLLVAWAISLFLYRSVRDHAI